MNAVTTPTTQHHPFNEAQWLRILFLIADTEQWLQQLHKDTFYQLPLKQHKKLLRNNWYLSASVLAHILERHYAPMARHPGAGKFTIGVERIVAIIKAAQLPRSRCRKAAITKGFGMRGALWAMMFVGVLRRWLR
ncbi:hypothetical protein LWM68_39705 [Niabella sp. W65]|nr:hypothetical protein [Niabella sp. W65]MCH7368324.1 hypothetical protein [Niabella sp. W65]